MADQRAHITGQLEQLKAELGSANFDPQKSGSLLSQLKVGLAELSLLAPDSNQNNVQDLVLGREVLETGAQWSIRARDTPSFERYFSQLKVYYTDFEKLLPESPNKYPLIGLNLLRLLSQQRIDEFHLMLETIDPQIMRENPYIRHPIALEQNLMEGSYNRVLASPYNSLSMNDAAQLLSIKSLPELSAFATEVSVLHVINRSFIMMSLINTRACH
ncbi:SAC3/GANP/Nin1/mts3/eIF-3 p25 family-domain-containing protein [Syncephalis plumigaleata]|nr:SAC3/GANP/Nin1/mts3/eIF-3 p25 family-domain-containing protein [Syncephalis plumigaleata]